MPVITFKSHENMKKTNAIDNLGSNWQLFRFNLHKLKKPRGIFFRLKFIHARSQHYMNLCKCESIMNVQLEIT
ncbi:CLUMA_CG020209, isoform A [Clunio marinus]|uniref:CLUMA_CG020209, isoform A n=1 Tax=Clunio marinus TaxID=568069 RepID=A0A1J1J639_9DIPT|nr:CLUMA_CG020209, isoform A [Clunio marinus]